MVNAPPRCCCLKWAWIEPGAGDILGPSCDILDLSCGGGGQDGGAAGRVQLGGLLDRRVVRQARDHCGELHLCVQAVGIQDACNLADINVTMRGLTPSRRTGAIDYHFSTPVLGKGLFGASLFLTTL